MSHWTHPRNPSRRPDVDREQWNLAHQQANRSSEQVKFTGWNLALQQTNRSLDQVRTTGATNPRPELLVIHEQNDRYGVPHTITPRTNREPLPARITLSHPVMPTQVSQPEPDEYSPTLSDIDALEESFLDLDIQSTQKKGRAKSQATSSSQNASFADHSRGGRSLLNSTPAQGAVLSPASSLADLELYTSRSIEDRLPLIWRKCPASFLFSVLLLPLKRRHILTKTAKSPKGLEEAPWPVLWEVTRAALECDVDIAHLNLQYDETWRDQDILWSALKSHPSFKARGQRLPPKSDYGAWRLALDNSPEPNVEAINLTITMHLTKSKVGPPLRLELDPLKREKSSRLLRKFGSDRFLEIRLPALESWQCGEGDLEAIAARWLTRAPHSFMERKWAGYYVLERSHKVETSEGSRGLDKKTVFYDRVLLFAEEGRNLLVPS